MAQPQFSQIVAAAAQESYVTQDLGVATPLIAGGTENIDVYAPNNTICELNFFEFFTNAPIGAASGKHSLGLKSTDSRLSYVFGESLKSSILQFGYGDWVVADSGRLPTTQFPLSVVNNIVFDSVCGLRFSYFNSTNVSQTGSRVYFIGFKKRMVG